MYNSNTESLIKQAPAIGDIDIERLPQELTKIYAKIVAIRRSISESTINKPKGFNKSIKLLRSLAANLETLVILDRNNEYKSSAAFVAATAQHLLATIFKNSNVDRPLERFTVNGIPSGISAMILFLISNSPADASEVSKSITVDSQDDWITEILFKALTYLSTGELENLKALRFKKETYNDPYLEAQDFLYELIFKGIHLLGLILLGDENQFEVEYFQNVMALSSFSLDDGFKSNYSGSYHLASLLEVLKDELLERGVIKVPPPEDVEPEQWAFFLRKLAKQRPYLWENHSEAIDTGFLEIGNSAVLTFPTGAGKTTLSEMKIAATLFSGQSVLYLVPTHALEDQVNRNLNALFDGLGTNLTIEIGGEYTELIRELPKITVMTPERCLTLLSVSPEIFGEIGLVVFDEFHLISGTDGRLERRALDAMFCLLRLFSELPTADYLLISAMVENGEEIAKWIEDVTGRSCHIFNSSWKPTRQLQGCLVFQNDEIGNLDNILREAKKKATTNAPGAALKRELKATAYQIFSLKNMWETDKGKDYHMSQILSSQVLLGTNPIKWSLTSNRNEVAADIAAHFAGLGIKTLVFVDQPKNTLSTAKKIMDKANIEVKVNTFSKRFKNNLRSLELELGDLKYSYYVADDMAAVHHGLMLPIERRLNEQAFKDALGPSVVVATATLAQGINLPAEIVIIAGDDRFDEETDSRQTVKPHEILNAAGRAGRAGSAAQGVVLIIPGEIVTFDEQSRLGNRWWELKNKVFSKSDQCLTVSDPLTDLLDSLTDEDNLTEEQKSIVFRLSVEDDSYNSVFSVFKNSFAAFKQDEDGDDLERGIQRLIDIKNNLAHELLFDTWVENVSIKMGIEPKVIESLGEAIDKETFEVLFDMDVFQIIDWMFDWLKGDTERIEGLFTSHGARVQLARALNLNKQKFTINEIAENFDRLKPILISYMTGADYIAIENMIEGYTDKFLLRARHFILKLIPHFSFSFGVLSIAVREKWLAEGNRAIYIPEPITMFSTLIREGFDSVEKLNYRLSNMTYSRVECHHHFDI